MKVKISFGPFVGIIADLVDFEPFTGRQCIIEWDAFRDSTEDNIEQIRWSKPYEEEEIDESTKNKLLYYTALEIRKLGYTCYRNEYIGDDIKTEIDRIIGAKTAPGHTKDNKKNTQGKASKDDAILYGLSFGVSFGMILGLIFKNSTLGLCIGPAIGLVAAIILTKSDIK
jgi:F0F1-type ATP synthase assembly protein I